MHMCGKSLHFIDLKTYLLLHFNHSKIRMSLVIGKRIFKNARIANIHGTLGFTCIRHYYSYFQV